jgi:hypothetical protein
MASTSMWMKRYHDGPTALPCVAVHSGSSVAKLAAQYEIRACLGFLGLSCWQWRETSILPWPRRSELPSDVKTSAQGRSPIGDDAAE